MTSKMQKCTKSKMQEFTKSIKTFAIPNLLKYCIEMQSRKDESPNSINNEGSNENRKPQVK